MDVPSLLRSLRDHTGLADASEAEALVVRVLWACSPLVPRHARQLLARRLPDEWMEALREDDPDAEAEGDRLVARLASVEQLEDGIAREQASVVLSHLAAYMDEPGSHALSSELPDDVRGWITPVDVRTVAPERPPREGHRLADGKPGTRQPLSEAKPAEGQSHSVAATDSPHADTKLSTATGTTQEREAETLAEGQPESRPISETE